MATDAATAVSGRRRWTTAYKLKIVSESLAPHASVTEVAHRHGLNPNLIYRWRHQAKAGALSRAPEAQSRFALVAVAAGSGARPSIAVRPFLGEARPGNRTTRASPRRA